MTVDELIVAFHLSPSSASALLHRLEAAEQSGDYEDVDRALDIADESTEGFGVEALNLEGLWHPYYCNIGLLYVNQGDPYDTTIWYDTRTRKFGLGSWGDWYEAHEHDEEEEMGIKEEPGSFGALAEEGLALVKEGEKLVETLQHQLDGVTDQLRAQQSMTERALKVAEDLVAEHKRCAGNLVTYRARHTHMAASLAADLVRASHWFQLTPLPEGHFDFTVKKEVGAIDMLRAWGAEEVKECVECDRR